MDKRKVLSVMALYRLKFEGDMILQIEFPHKRKLTLKDLKLHALEHCHFMLDGMNELVQQGHTEKASQCLNFIQGVLWVLRVFTLQEITEHNRPVPVERGRHATH